MRKKIKRLFWGVVAAAVLLLFINSVTDWFSNIDKYIPSLARNNPEIVETIERISERVSSYTDAIPSPAELAAIIKNEEIPIDPEDVAHNAYISDSPMLMFCPSDNVSVQMKDEDTVSIFGIQRDKEKSHIAALFADLDNEEIEQTAFAVNSSGEFSRNLHIPDTDEDIIKLDIYTGSKQYGSYQSMITDYIYLVRTDSGWELEEAAALDGNRVLYEKDKSISEALKTTASIKPESFAIQTITEQVTAACETNYDKALAIHDWICNNIYYDTDSVESGEVAEYAADAVLQKRRAVCLGFATLTASMCRSAGIPCSVVSGYALGVGDDLRWNDENLSTSAENHAWNEAYVDGRWIIIDTTWDTMNKYTDGQKTDGDSIRHLYFDANIDFFSANHRIIEYKNKI